MKLRETVIVSGGFLAQQVSVFAIGVLIARFLGTEGFGVIAILKTLSSLLVIVTPLGLDLALLKHAAFYHDRPAELRKVSSALRLIVAGCNLLLLCAVLAWLGPMLADIYGSIPGFASFCSNTMLGLVFAADLQVSSALYRVRGQVVLYSVVVNYGQPFLRLLVTLIVLLAGGNVSSVVWVNTAMFAFAWLALARVGPRGPMRFGMQAKVLGSKISGILSESMWMAVSLLVYQSIRLVDVLILAALAGAQAAGQYTAMSSVAQLIQIYPNAVSQTLGPRIALAYKEHDMPGIVLALNDYLRKAAILGGFLFGGVAVFGVDLDLLFGRGFSFPWLLPALLSIGWYLSAILAPFGYVLSMTGRHRQEVVILSLGAAFLVACLLLFVPIFAAVGAALSVAIVFAAVNAMRCGYVIRIIGSNPLGWKDVWPPAAFLVAALCCRLGGTALISRGLPGLVLSCCTYSVLSGLLIWVAFVTAEERRLMSQGLRPRRVNPS